MPPASQNQVTVAHVGDLHFWSFPANPLLLLNKRLAGVLNLLVGRARKFRQDQAPLLVERLRLMNPDYLLFSGDFTTTSLPAEFDKARAAFHPLAASASIECHAVPGNHDCYIRAELGGVSFAKCLGREFLPETAQSLVQIPPSLALIRLNATTANGLGAYGKITAKHTDFIADSRERLASSFKLAILLCHFPPEDPPGVLRHDRGIQLKDAKPLLDLLASLPMPVLWLHGHHHHRWIYGSPTVRNLTYLNAGAPLMRWRGGEPDLGFHELRWDGAKLSITTHYLASNPAEWRELDVKFPLPGEFIDLQAHRN